jgi:hypothetical protein
MEGHARIETFDHIDGHPATAPRVRCAPSAPNLFG